VFKALSDAPFFASYIEGVRDLKAIDATQLRFLSALIVLPSVSCVGRLPTVQFRS
jgi:hypothetical protein